MLKKIKEWFHISQRRKKHKKIEVLETVRPFSKDEGFILYPLDDEPNKHMYGNGQWIKANPNETNVELFHTSSSSDKAMNEVIDALKPNDTRRSYIPPKNISPEEVYCKLKREEKLKKKMEKKHE